jgi:hypothetical protein
MEATATKPRTTTFFAKYPDLIVGITSPREVKNFNGDVVFRSTEIDAATATEEELTATNPEMHGAQRYFCRVYFDGHSATVSEAVANRLREHFYFNSDFWEQGNEPDALRPLVEDQLAALRTAERERNIDAALTVVAKEETTHRRRIVLEAAKDILAYLQSEAPVEAVGPDPSNGSTGEPEAKGDAGGEGVSD